MCSFAWSSKLSNLVLNSNSESNFSIHQLWSHSNRAVYRFDLICIWLVGFGCVGPFEALPSRLLLFFHLRILLGIIIRNSIAVFVHCSLLWKEIFSWKTRLSDLKFKLKSFMLKGRRTSCFAQFVNYQSCSLQKPTTSLIASTKCQIQTVDDVS